MVHIRTSELLQDIAVASALLEFDRDVLPVNLRSTSEKISYKRKQVKQTK